MLPRFVFAREVRRLDFYENMKLEPTGTRMGGGWGVLLPGQLGSGRFCQQGVEVGWEFATHSGLAWVESLSGSLRGLTRAAGGSRPLSSWRHLLSSSLSTWGRRHLEPLRSPHSHISESSGVRDNSTLAATWVDQERRAESTKTRGLSSALRPSDNSALATAQAPPRALPPGVHTLAYII